MDEFVYKCIVCDVECRGHKDFGETISILYDALVCRTNGNYGSRLYDSDGNEFLQFALCDKCLQKCGDKIYRVELERRKPLVAKKIETYSEYHNKELQRMKEIKKD